MENEGFPANLIAKNIKGITDMKIEVDEMKKKEREKEQESYITFQKQLKAYIPHIYKIPCSDCENGTYDKLKDC